MGLQKEGSEWLSSINLFRVRTKEKHPSLLFHEWGVYGVEIRWTGFVKLLELNARRRACVRDKLRRVLPGQTTAIALNLGRCRNNII